MGVGDGVEPGRGGVALAGAHVPAGAGIELEGVGFAALGDLGDGFEAGASRARACGLGGHESSSSWFTGSSELGVGGGV